MYMHTVRVLAKGFRRIKPLKLVNMGRRMKRVKVITHFLIHPKRVLEMRMKTTWIGILLMAWMEDVTWRVLSLLIVM